MLGGLLFSMADLFLHGHCPRQYVEVCCAVEVGKLVENTQLPPEWCDATMTQKIERIVRQCQCGMLRSCCAQKCALCRVPRCACCARFAGGDAAGHSDGAGSVHLQARPDEGRAAESAAEGVR